MTRDLAWREAQRIRTMARGPARHNPLPDLRLAAQILGRTPGGAAYARLRSQGRLSPNAITAAMVASHYGTWADACRAAGLEPHPRPSSPKWGAPHYSDEEIFEKFIDWKHRHSEWPGCSAWDRAHMRPTGAAIRRRFGGWVVALRAAEAHLNTTGRPPIPPLEELDLSSRCYNSLWRAGFRYTTEVLSCSEQDLLEDIPQFGCGQLAELQEVLASYNLYLQPSLKGAA